MEFLAFVALCVIFCIGYAVSEYFLANTKAKVRIKSNKINKFFKATSFKPNLPENVSVFGAVFRVLDILMLIVGIVCLLSPKIECEPYKQHIYKTISILLLTVNMKIAYFSTSMLTFFKLGCMFISVSILSFTVPRKKDKKRRFHEIVGDIFMFIAPIIMFIGVVIYGIKLVECFL